MLFLESKTLDCYLDEATRLSGLESLRDKGFMPLILTMRRRGFEVALQGQTGTCSEEQLKKTERAVAERMALEGRGAYVQGDIFCFEGFVLFLIFQDSKDKPYTTDAGIIFTATTAEPLDKLDNFCKEVSASLARVQQENGGTQVHAQAGEEWRRSTSFTSAGYARFVAKQDIDFLYTSSRREMSTERLRAAELLEDNDVRQLLRRIKGALVEGCASKLLLGDGSAGPVLSVEKLSAAGLLAHEVLISCRKTGHALFRLPSSDTLAVITVSKAKCSECGTFVADEKIEEVITPTELTSALLEDSSWLVNRIYFIIRNLGVPQSEIASGPVTEQGDAHMMVNICGKSFILTMRDGDLTPAVARRAVDLAVETEATHMVFVTTGKILNESRTHLLAHARRRERVGEDIEVIIIEGTDGVEAELTRAFERVSTSVVAEHLCQLDVSSGFSTSHLVFARFELGSEADPQRESTEHRPTRPPYTLAKAVKYQPPLLISRP